MSVLEALVGWLAPPGCVGCGLEGSALCLGCSTSVIMPFGERCWRCDAISLGGRTCPVCRHVSGPSFVWINTHYEGLSKDLVSLYKFGHQRAAANPIARMMTDTFLEYNQPAAAARQGYLVVPVPTASSRVRERGFGHAELLARRIAGNLKMEYGPALRRLDQTRQLGSVRQDRLTQLANSFAASPRRVRGRNILLVDDVLTTGGTLVAAAKTLRAAGATGVCALVFAKRL